MKLPFWKFVLVVGLALYSQSGQAQANLAPWERVVSPNLSTEHNLLLSVAAVSSSDVWAVGNYDANPDPYQSAIKTMVQHWNGTQWSVVPSPNVNTGWNGLEAVAAVSANDVWAVGYWSKFNGLSQALIERWNGSQWQVVPSPQPEGGAALSAITVVSANDIWAAGLRKGIEPEPSGASFIVHWNGSSWTQVPSPNAGDYRNFWYGIHAISANDIWVVGQSRSYVGILRTMAAHWDGTRWTLVPTPNGSQGGTLTGVSGVASNDVWIVGAKYTDDSWERLFLHWNGSQFEEVASPSGGQVVRAIASNDVWSVGNGTAHWDGTAWQDVPAATVPGSIGEGLFGIAVTSSAIWTVGRYYTEDNGIFTLTERRDSTPPPAAVSGGIGLPSVANSGGLQFNLQFRPEDGSASLTRTVTLDANGKFAVTGIPARLYKLGVKGNRWQQRVVPLDLRRGDVTNLSAALVPGDVNGDNVTDITDLTALIAHYNTARSGTGYLESADFTNDGTIDIADLLLLIGNYNTQGDS